MSAQTNKKDIKSSDLTSNISWLITLMIKCGYVAFQRKILHPNVQRKYTRRWVRYYAVVYVFLRHIGTHHFHSPKQFFTAVHYAFTIYQSLETWFPFHENIVTVEGLCQQDKASCHKAQIGME